MRARRIHCNVQATQAAEARARTEVGKLQAYSQQLESALITARDLASQREAEADEIQSRAARALRSAIDAATVRIETRCASVQRAAVRAAMGAATQAQNRAVADAVRAAEGRAASSWMFRGETRARRGWRSKGWRRWRRWRRRRPRRRRRCRRSQARRCLKKRVDSQNEEKRTLSYRRQCVQQLQVQ